MGRETDMSAQSPMFVKTETFLVWLLDHTRKFPRHEQPRLARRIEEAAFGFHECLLRAAHSPSARTHLLEADLQLDKLRAYLRLALECRYTAPNQYGYAAEHLLELGKLLGGWLKTTTA